jgi:hypothetical protein
MITTSKTAALARPINWICAFSFDLFYASQQPLSSLYDRPGCVDFMKIMRNGERISA